MFSTLICTHYPFLQLNDKGLISKLQVTLRCLVNETWEAMQRRQLSVSIIDFWPWVLLYWHAGSKIASIWIILWVNWAFIKSFLSVCQQWVMSTLLFSGSGCNSAGITCATALPNLIIRRGPFFPFLTDHQKTLQNTLENIFLVSPVFHQKTVEQVNAMLQEFLNVWRCIELLLFLGKCPNWLGRRRLEVSWFCNLTLQ